MVNLPVLDHCQDYDLVGNGVINEGYWSTLLGLPGWPAAGEEAIVMRNILLAELCDHHIHCQHISAAGSVRLIDRKSTRLNSSHTVISYAVFCLKKKKKKKKRQNEKYYKQENTIKDSR